MANFPTVAAQCHVSGSDDALNTASSVLLRLATPRPTIASCPQALYWSERFLSKLALIAGEKVSARDPTSNDTSTEIALKAFRLWSVHPQVKRTGSSGYPYSQSAGASEPPSQTSMWMSYYELLSTILQHNMTYFPPSQGPTRGHLATEIRRVEAVCESVLLREVRFPKANARNPQVESWVGKVIRNWEVLCGPGWRDDDFGEGGQDAVGRNVLDVGPPLSRYLSRMLTPFSRFSTVLPPRHITPTLFYDVCFTSMRPWQNLSWPSKLWILILRS